jgi:hypothetical protein
MKRTYRIRPSDRKPTDEEIARYRDPARLQANYNKALRMLHRKPLYKDPRAFIAVVIIVLLAWFISTAVGEEGKAPPPVEQVQP